MHVDGKRKGILDTIGLDDIHSVIGKRSSKLQGGSNTQPLQLQQQQQQWTLLPQDLPLLTSRQYHSKFCIPRRNKRLRQQQQQQQQSGVQQFNVPTFGSGIGGNKDFSRRNSADGTRMIMEDLLLLQNNGTGLSSRQQQPHHQLPGGGSLGYPYRDSFRNSFALPFGTDTFDTFGGGSGGGGFGGHNPTSLMDAWSRARDSSGGEKINDTAYAAANAAGSSGALPQSAFSALNSLAPELRERMLRMAKLAEPEDEGKKDDSATNDAKILQKAEKKRAKKDKEEGDDVDDGKKKKYKPLPTRKSQRKKKLLEKKASEDSLATFDNSNSSGAAVAVGGRRTTDYTVLSPNSFKPESFFSMRNSMVDAAALSLGSAGDMRDVLGPSGMISGGGGGSGIGNFQDRINMMQLVGMNPPPFGGGGGPGGGAMMPPFGRGVGGGYNPGAGLARKFNPSLSLDDSISPPFDADAKNQMIAALASFKKIGKKDDNVPSAAVGSGIKRKEFSSSTKKKNSSGKKKKKNAKKESPAKDANVGDEVEKPKRPFSAYNLFFQLEREFIMFTIADGGNAREDTLIKIAVEAVEEANKKGEGKGKGISVKVDEATVKEALEGKGIVEDFDIDVGLPSNTPPPPQIKVPPRYKHLKLEDHWYCVSRKVKRKHRKTEGSCGFLELTKMVSSRWKTVDCTDPQVKEWCRKVAEKQLETYKRDVAEHKKWLAAHPAPDDDDTITIDDIDEYTPSAGQKPSLPTSMSMGLGASPFEYGKMHHSFFDPRMSDMARFSDLSQAAQMAGNRMMMPSGPAQSLPPLPPPPFTSSLGLGERLNERGGDGRPMDETERRFAALAEQESRRRIQTEMQMSSLMRPPPLGNGFGSLGASMGGLGDSRPDLDLEAHRFLDRSNRIGGFSSMMPPVNQGNMQLNNEEMMAQIMRMKQNLTNENGLEQGAAGGLLPQPPFGGVGGKKDAANDKSDSDDDDNDEK